MVSSKKDEFLLKIILVFSLIMLAYLLHHYLNHKTLLGNNIILNLAIKISPIILFNLACYALGAKILDFLWQEDWSFNYQIVLSLALGFVFYYLLGMTISLLHILSTTVLWITVLIPLLLFWRKIWELLSHFSRIAGLIKIKPFSPSLLLIITLVLYLILALSPPCWNDPMGYHLVMPKEYLENGGIPDQAYTMMGYTPSAMHMLYLYLMGIGNDYLPKLQHLLFFILTLYIFYYNIRLLSNTKIAFYSALLFCCQWLIFHGVQRANVDFHYTFYSLLSFFLILNITKSEGKNVTAPFIMIAIFTGAAISSKYTSLCHLVAIEVLFFVLVFLKKMTIRHFLVANTIALAIFLPCMIRNYIYTGDPLFWMLSGKLHIYDVASKVHLQTHQDLCNLVTPKATPFLFLMTPFYIYIHGRFPTTYFDAFIDPFYMITFFLGILFLKKHIFLRYIYLYIVVYYCSWFLTNAITRYMLPLVPLLGFITIFFFINLMEHSATKFYLLCQKIFLAIIVLFCTFNIIDFATSASYFFAKNIAVFVGKMDRETFLKPTNAGDQIRINKYLEKRGTKDDRIYMILYQNTYYLKYQALCDSLGGNLSFLKHLDDAGQDPIQWLRYHKYKYVLIDIARYAWLHGPSKNQNLYLHPYEKELAILHESWGFLEQKLSEKLVFEKQFGYLLLYRVPNLNETNHQLWPK